MGFIVGQLKANEVPVKRATISASGLLCDIVGILASGEIGNVFDGKLKMYMFYIE